MWKLKQIFDLSNRVKNLLTPLWQSRNTVKNTNEFIEELEQQKISQEHNMISFDVKSLFTNVPLDSTIGIILKRMYENNEIVTSTAKNEMMEILIL